MLIIQHIPQIGSESTRSWPEGPLVFEEDDWDIQVCLQHHCSVIEGELEADHLFNQK
jgi:hypothetical protein